MAETILSEENIGGKESQNNQDYELDEHVAFILEQLNDDKIPH